MNIFDKVIEIINPNIALKREDARRKLSVLKSFSNSGYSEGGASYSKNSLKGFLGDSKSPFEDIDKNLHVLRQRSRLLYMQAPIATSAIKNVRTNVVGQGLRVKSRIDFKYLGIGQEQADIWEKNTEREFNLWAESKYCDVKGSDNFFELQQIAMTGWLLNGDAFAVIKRAETTPYMPYTLRLHLIEADRVSTPKSTVSSNISTTLDSGNLVYNGVEVDKNGAIIAYHICNTYPNGNSSTEKKWTRIESVGDITGIPNIIHVMEGERAEQYRGVPFLSVVIESIKQITRYTEAELMAAVINGFFTVFIQTESGNDDVDFQGVIDDDDKISSGDDYQLGPGVINILKNGESVNAVDPKRPNVNFDMFVTAMSKHIGAALEIPYEALLKSFNSSYSASRAALMEAWKSYRMRRSWFSNDFCQPTYEIFLSEAVSSGRIIASGFFLDPLVRKAWCSAEWNGPAPGQIDPVKEVVAAEKRINLGLTTREKETAELTGGDFDRNIEQLKLESEKMKDLNLFEVK